MIKVDHTTYIILSIIFYWVLVSIATFLAVYTVQVFRSNQFKANWCTIVPALTEADVDDILAAEAPFDGVGHTLLICAVPLMGQGYLVYICLLAFCKPTGKTIQHFKSVLEKVEELK